MSIALAYREDGEFLLVEAGGRWTASNMRDAIGSLRAEAEKRTARNLLVDARAVSMPDTELTRFFTGVHWAELFPTDFCTAFVVEPALYNGFAELVARNRGANVAVFFDEASAKKWLAS